jgi:hypothetical protein
MTAVLHFIRSAHWLDSKLVPSGGGEKPIPASVSSSPMFWNSCQLCVMTAAWGHPVRASPWHQVLSSSICKRQTKKTECKCQRPFPTLCPLGTRSHVVILFLLPDFFLLFGKLHFFSAQTERGWESPGELLHVDNGLIQGGHDQKNSLSPSETFGGRGLLCT